MPRSPGRGPCGVAGVSVAVEFGDLPGEWADHPGRPCADPALGTNAQRARLFFPVDGAGAAAAKRRCEKCPVKTPCLDFALETKQDYGVWGGTSERERRRIRRRRSAS